jgi:chaperonin GroEL (HSP60 family)
MGRAGIFDAASVVKTAISSAIHGAALALTIDVLVHRANPPVETNP